jgi:hypothetical protein
LIAGGGGWPAKSFERERERERESMGARKKF